MPNALYRPSVDNAVAEMFGMQPNLDRLNLLPRHDKRQGWIAPNALYQLARAAVAPGVAARGGDVSPEDALNFAGNVSLGGIGASAAMKDAAPGYGKTVGMMVTPHTGGRGSMAPRAMDVLVNPRAETLLQMVKSGDVKPGNSFRYVRDSAGNIYAWPAEQATHSSILNGLQKTGTNFDFSMKDSPLAGWFEVQKNGYVQELDHVGFPVGKRE
jgi:hypothetical protein